MRRSIEIKAASGLALAALSVLIVTLLAYRNGRDFVETSRWVDHTQEVLTELDGVSAADAGMTDAGADV